MVRRLGRLLAGALVGAGVVVLASTPAVAATRSPSSSPSSSSPPTAVATLPSSLGAPVASPLPPVVGRRGPPGARRAGMGTSPVAWDHGKHGGRTRNGLESTNWSGLVAEGEGFPGGVTEPVAAVDGDWQVPTVATSQAEEYSGTWIGIDGVSSDSLIQAGTLEESGGGSTSYSAWYELLPAGAVTLDEPVAPGDDIEASIQRQGVTSDTWTIAMADLAGGSTRWETSFDVPYSSPGDSAEWIEEAPTVNGVQSTLADFGTLQFTDLGLESFNAATSYPLVPVSMADGAGVVISYPGPYDEATDSFPVTYGTPAPDVESVSPSQGGTSGGTSVTIDGDYLTGASSVSFGGTPVPFSYDPDNSVTAVSPPAPAGTVDVTVVTPGGSGTGLFTYVAPAPSRPAPSSGYDLVGRDGGVFVFGSGSGFYGSLPGIHVHVSNIVGMVATNDDRGYFLVGSDGGVFAFGDAPFMGSLPGERVHIDDVVGIIPTADDRGYFLVGADGGVFTFGDAHFLGSLPGRGIHTDDIIGIAANANDTGYWVIAANGQVYCFGSAANFGSYLGSASPVSAIAATPDGGGYRVVAQNGSVFSFGDARFFGSLPGIHVDPTHPVIGVVPIADGGGYWLIGADGGIFAFGDAPFVGSLPGLHVSVTDIVGAVPTRP
ncbi:MAG TPA: G1 family glutamic endopeptidase [Acidimicrobiales bacterium]|nr:G1 family glutamic endopeptidase [Acidimicrobiales bacterium]